MDPLTAIQWSPYLAGAGIGVLLCLSMLLSAKPLGCGVAFTTTAGMIEGLIKGREKVSEKPYFQMFPLRIDWQWMLVAGIIIGAFISAMASGTFYISWVPYTFAQAFGYSPVLRVLTALIGGVLVGLGARWCWGCPSSHGISGIPQLSLASCIAVACMFAVGIATALLMYHI